ncbi:HTTM domain-containing protein [Pseudonocardia lutea]|jgi:hypothetical protein|uniref:HTTM domain-containing protein n=1 Tax=Pseudonocardia lutea TaxID=2172015 RepID=A0ABW1I2D9_9PSEU
MIPETVPARPLAAYRIVLGLVAVVRALALTANPYLGNRPHPLYPFLPALPTPVWTAVGLVMLAAAVFVVLGVRARPAAATVGICVLVLMWGAGYYGNGAFLLATMSILISFTRCDADLALRPRRYADGVWAPPVYLMRAQITIVYFYAALGKLSLDFLSGNGLASWGVDSFLAPRFLLVLPVLATMAVGAVATELFVAVALWFRRTRPVAIALGLLLHLCMIGWISDSLIAVVELTCFAATTTGAYLLFVDRLPHFVERRIPTDREAARA